jgi:hypothetical protein
MQKTKVGNATKPGWPATPDTRRSGNTVAAQMVSNGLHSFVLLIEH